jgi:hypothetical protein
MIAVMEIIERYQKQYEEFCQIDDFNLEERAKRVPAEKHFWVCRLIDAEIQKDRLLRQKNKLKSELEGKLAERSPVKMDKKFLEGIDKSPSLDEINEKIKQHEFLIRYLDMLVRQVTFIAQDIKNIIEVKKLQEL